MSLRRWAVKRKETDRHAPSDSFQVASVSVTEPSVACRRKWAGKGMNGSFVNTFLPAAVSTRTLSGYRHVGMQLPRHGTTFSHVKPGEAVRRLACGCCKKRGFKGGGWIEEVRRQGQGQSISNAPAASPVSALDRQVPSTTPCAHTTTTRLSM